MIHKLKSNRKNMNPKMTKINKMKQLNNTIKNKVMSL